MKRSTSLCEQRKCPYCDKAYLRKIENLNRHVKECKVLHQKKKNNSLEKKKVKDCSSPLPIHEEQKKSGKEVQRQSFPPAIVQKKVEILKAPETVTPKKKEKEPQTFPQEGMEGKEKSPKCYESKKQEKTTSLAERNKKIATPLTVRLPGRGYPAD